MAKGNSNARAKRLDVYDDQAALSVKGGAVLAATALLAAGTGYAIKSLQDSLAEKDYTHGDQVHDQKAAEKAEMEAKIRSYGNESKRAQLLAQKAEIDLRCLETYDWGCRVPVRQYTSDNTSRDAPYVGKHQDFELKQEVNSGRFSREDKLTCDDGLQVFKGGDVSAHVEISNLTKKIKSALIYAVNRTTGDIEGDVAVISGDTLEFRANDINSGQFGAHLMPLRAGPKEVHMLLNDGTGTTEEFRLGQPFYMVGSDVEFACDDDHPTMLTPLTWTPSYNGVPAKTEPGYMWKNANGNEITIKGEVGDEDGIKRVTAVLKRGIEEVKILTKLHAGARNVSIDLPLNQLGSGHYDLQLTVEDTRGNQRSTREYAPFNLVDPAKDNLTHFEGAELWHAFQSLEDALNGTEVPVLDCKNEGFVTAGKFLRLNPLHIEDIDAIKRVDIEIYTPEGELGTRREFSGSIHRPLVDGQVAAKVHMPLTSQLETGVKNTIITVEDHKGNKESIQRWIKIEDEASCDPIN